jgi:hypothetical protein
VLVRPPGSCFPVLPGSTRPATRPPPPKPIFGSLARAALEPTDDDLRDDDLSNCQAIGEAAEYLGREGIIIPSATGSGTVLAVFFDRLDPDSAIEVIDFETWEAAPESSRKRSASRVREVPNGYIGVGTGVSARLHARANSRRLPGTLCQP